MKKNPLIYHEKIFHDLREIAYFNQPFPTLSLPIFVLLRKLHDLTWNSLYSKGYYFDYARNKWNYDVFSQSD